MERLLKRIFGGGDGVNEGLPEEPHEQESRQPHRGEIIESLDHVYALHQRFAEHTEGRKRSTPQGREFHFDKENTHKGVSAALLMLGGIPAVGTGAFLRGAPHTYVTGSVLGFLGAQCTSRGALELLDYFWGVPRRAVEKQSQAISHKTLSGEDDAAPARISERSLRIALIKEQARALDHDTQLRKNRKDFLRKKEQFPEVESTLKFWHQENLHAILDDIISAQTTLLTSMKAYRDLMRYQDERVQWKPLGFGVAEDVLMGVLKGDHQFVKKVQDFFSAPSMNNLGRVFDAESVGGQLATLVSFWMGLVVEMNAFRSKAKDVDTIDEVLDDLGQELKHLDGIRARVERRLPTLAKQAGIQGVYEEQESHDYEQWRTTFHQVIAGARTVQSQHSTETLSFFRQPSGSLEIFLGLTSARHPASEDTGGTHTEEEGAEGTVEQPELPRSKESVVARSGVKPLDRTTLVERTPIDSIDRKLVHDFYAIVGKEVTVHEESFTGDPEIVTAVLDSLAKDPTVSVQQLDEILDYMERLGATLKANQSILDFRKGHIRTILEHKEEIEAGLERRERVRVTRVLKDLSPDAMRNFLFSQYGIAEADRHGELSQHDFEMVLRTWMRKDGITERDRAPLRRFLELCEKELNQLPTNVPWKQPKESIVGRALRILNEHISDVPFSSEQEAQNHEDRCRDLEPIVATYFEERDASKIPGIGMVARLTFESKFISPDDIYEIGYDRRREQKDRGLRNISTGAIIGSYIGFEAEGVRKGWVKTRQEDPAGEEEGEVMNRARPLMAQDATVETFDAFFFDAKSGRENIEVMRIPGIEKQGDLFFVMRGIKHVAAAKIAGLPRIAARVHEVRQGTPTQPLEIVTSNLDRYTRMRQMRDKGLIEGEFLDSFSIGEGQSSYSAIIRRQVFPWLIWFSVQNIPDICSAYQSLYPSAFENLRTLKGDPLVANTFLHYQPFVTWLMRRGASSTA